MEIELTETATASKMDHVKQLFQRLQDKGIQTSLDDFGAGYSILNAVVDIPVNTLKLDRSFANQCWETERGMFFLRQIVSMVKGIGCQVICEGIETKEQAQVMREVGCSGAQGYWFAAPMPAEEFETKYLKEKQEKNEVF